MDTIKRILGEEEEILEPEQSNGTDPELLPNRNRLGAEDAEIDELSNLWNTGNKGEVIRRYTEMNNEDSVKLVFAIGMEGALDLARMVDQMLEQNENPDNDEEPDSDSDSTEPVRIEPPAPATDRVQQIIGNSEEVPA
jgi:hypothetical protein